METKLKGADGIDGEDGQRGPQINTLPKGSPAPTDADNFILGDMILHLGTYDLYQVNGDNDNKKWVGIGNIKGATGPQGTTGPQGETGSYTKATKITDATKAVSITMQQSVYYELTHSNITAISLTLGSVESGTVGEFICEFTINTGNNVPTITLPSGVKYANNWTYADFEPGYRYTIYILNNIAYV